MTSTIDLRTNYPAGVPCWAVLRSSAPELAASFCADLFGWTIDTGGPWELLARLDGGAVAGFEAARQSVGIDGWCTYVATDEIGSAVERVVAAGGRVVDGPVSTANGDRRAAAVDPGGVPFGLWEGRHLAGAEVVNAPGSWNWSDLEADDPAGAERFYGAVFGWRTLSMDLGGAEMTMWCLPGYGDHLATLDPTLRERHAEPGVPEGFSDAVGWLRAPDGGPPGWAVTFAVDDPDEVAERAVALGGQVVVAASNAGPTRLAVIAEPTGATFTVSSYRPED